MRGEGRIEVGARSSGPELSHGVMVLVGCVVGASGVGMMAGYLGTVVLAWLASVGFPSSPWLVAGGLGLVVVAVLVISHGKFPPRGVSDELSSHPPGLLAGWGAGLWVMGIVIFLKTITTQPDSTTRVGGWVLLGGALVVGALALAGAVSRRDTVRCSRSDTVSLSLQDKVSMRSVVSVGLAIAVLAQMGSIVMKAEIYPFSPFKMYSGLRLDPYERAHGRVVGVRDDSRTVDLSRGVSGATVQRWLREDDPERLQALVDDLVARYQARTNAEIVSYSVVREIWRVRPYPGEAGMELRSETTVLVVER